MAIAEGATSFMIYLIQIYYPSMFSIRDSRRTDYDDYSNARLIAIKYVGFSGKFPPILIIMFHFYPMLFCIFR